MKGINGFISVMNDEVSAIDIWWKKLLK
jgi:hypothetical protein